MNHIRLRIRTRHAEVSDPYQEYPRPVRLLPAGAPVTIDPDGRGERERNGERCSRGVLARASSSDFRLYVDLSASWEYRRERSVYRAR